MRWFLLSLIVLRSMTASSAAIYPQAVSDNSFNTTVAHPAFVKRHPKVLFDDAHNNAHTSRGTYNPFVDLITSDGYMVIPNKADFSKKSLSGHDVLAIVNASGP